MNAMPVYWMGLFKVPGCIINEIDKVRRWFFWGEYLSGDSWSKKLHTINWNRVCISKTSGGLGLSFLTHKNISLLVKWFWKLHNDRNSLWYKVITGKYGSDIKDFLSSYNNSCSQNLSPTMKSLLEAYQCLPSRFKNMDNFVWSVGNGKNIQFWHDKWHALGILKHKFPRLFSIYIHRNDSIRDAVSRLSSYTTDSRWRRPLRQWELEEVSALNSIISSIQLTSQRDTLSWHDMSKWYSTAKCYNWLSGTSQEDKFWSIIWKIKIPSKVRFFIWQCGHNILPTLSLLKKRNVVTQDQCKWCLSESEDMAHILWNCDIAKKARSKFSRWLEIDLVSLHRFDIRELLLKLQKMDKSLGSCLCLAALLWTVWNIRNEFTFQQIRIKDNQLEFLIKHRAFSWAKALGLVEDHHHPIWIINPLIAFKSHRSQHLKKLVQIWVNVSNHVAFIDASLKKNSGNIWTAGIRGFLLSNNNSLAFLFSGPANQNTVLNSEKEALMFLLNNIVAKVNLFNFKLTVFTDAKELVILYHKESSEQLDSPLVLLVKNHFKDFKLVHIDRAMNQAADYLTKSGMHRRRMIAGWLNQH